MKTPNMSALTAKKIFCAVALFLLLQAPAFATQQPRQQILTNGYQPTSNPPTYVINGQAYLIGAPIALMFCASQSIRVCDQNIPITPSMLSQTAVSLQPNAPYQPIPVTAQCIVTMMGPTISYSSSTSPSCQLETCSAAKVTFCGKEILVPAGTTAGNTITIPVPSSMLSHPSISNGQLITATCIPEGDKMNYQITDTSGISCNDFPCADADLQVCNMPIHIRGGAAFADVVELTMPPPFAPDRFTVQCVNNNAEPPSYQPLNLSAVTCRTQ